MPNERDVKRLKKVQRWSRDRAFAAHAALLDIADELEATREQSRAASDASAKGAEAIAAAIREAFSRPLVSVEIAGDVTVEHGGES